MGREIYPPKDMSQEEWLCDLMCGAPEKEEESNDRTEEATGTTEGNT